MRDQMRELTTEAATAADRFADAMKELSKTIATISKRQVLLSEIMLDLGCTYCGAHPGVGCQTKSGRPCQMHSARWYAALPLWHRTRS